VTPYRHTETSLLNLVALGVPMVACAAAFLIVPMPSPWTYLVLGLAVFFLVLVILFHSLTIEIDEREIRMHFGPGLVRKKWTVSGCLDARRTKTRLIDGWGIKLTNRGWLYSVSMPDAVLIRFTTGKSVQLGTDEPEALLAALLEAGVDIDEDGT